ncbi:hypothetical protein [Campylobacter geochelonis]|uniref:Uncharacterized protein n=1 Tax=Campylobacter geochelonis TaxID=1780362 RepID=A0A128EGJ9_9BACT|nr:hypothetical protein [Campylobacter geochelonis]QKF70846.1 hypothetical protein CGEO_0523 [Campylobacter geochelonis]CZE48024.1 Uncharacterised protein [Campylobacter geochelonis]
MKKVVFLTMVFLASANAFFLDTNSSDLNKTIDDLAMKSKLLNQNFESFLKQNSEKFKLFEGNLSIMSEDFNKTISKFSDELDSLQQNFYKSLSDLNLTVPNLNINKK